MSAVVEQPTPPSIYKVKKEGKGNRSDKRGKPAKGFFGRSAKKTAITIDEAIAILGSRLKWCNGKIDLYDGEDVAVKYLDNLSKLAGPLIQAFKMRGIEVKDEQDLAKIFEEIAKRKEAKKTFKLFISE